MLPFAWIVCSMKLLLVRVWMKSIRVKVICRSCFPKSLKRKNLTLNQRQQYETFNGKEVDIVSDNYPIFKNSQVLGAYSVMEDFSQLDSLHRKILELQDELLRQDAQIKGEKKSR